MEKQIGMAYENDVALPITPHGGRRHELVIEDSVRFADGAVVQHEVNSPLAFDQTMQRLSSELQVAGWVGGPAGSSAAMLAHLDPLIVLAGGFAGTGIALGAIELYRRFNR